jgi:hypothetical protein
MDKQRARQLYELADRLSKLDVNTLSEEQLSHRNTMIAKLQEEVKDVKEEFNGEYDDEGAVLNNVLQVLKNEVELPLSEYIPKNVLRSSLSPIQNLVQSAINNLSIPVNYESIQEANGEYDDEAGMAKSNLRTMARAVNGLLDTIEDNDNLPEWAQEKIAKAEMMTTSVWDYLLSQKEQGMDPKVAEDVTEDNDHSLKKVWDRYSKHLMASRGDHPDVTQIHKSGEITRKIRKYVRDHHGQKAVDDMERYADKRQWSEGIAETKKPSPKLTPVSIKKSEPVSEEINTEAYERLQKVFAFKNYES